MKLWAALAQQWAGSGSSRWGHSWSRGGQPRAGCWALSGSPHFNHWPSVVSLVTIEFAVVTKC